MGNGNVFCVNESNQDNVKTDIGGWEGWLHKPDSPKRSDDFKPSLSASAPSKDETPLALTEELHAAYSEALSLCNEPAPYHVEDLLKRGATREQIKMWGFKQWAQVRRIYDVDSKARGRFLADKVFEAVGDVGVPGFGKRKFDNGPRAGDWYRTCYTRVPELAIPIRRPCGSIVGIQVKNDPRLTRAELKRKKQGKYQPLTCGSNIKGAAWHNPLHCARPPEHLRRCGRPVFITEGVLKAQLACILLGCDVIGLPGQYYDSEMLQSYLRALNSREVVIAFDEDAKDETRRTTESNATKSANEIFSWGGFVAKVASWNPAKGKGIDDFLNAGGTFEELEIHSPRYLRPKRTIQPDDNLVNFAELPPTMFDQTKPMIPREEQQFRIGEIVEHVCLNRSKYENDIYLLPSPPGIGKSTTGRAAIRLAGHKDPSLRAGYFGSAHKGIKPERGDGSLRGREHLCSHHDNEHARRGVPWKHICGACPSRGICNGSQQDVFGSGPGYLKQFPRSLQQVNRLTFLATNYLFNPKSIEDFKFNVIVIDDSDLKSYTERSRLVVTDSDLAQNIREAEEVESLKPSLPLLKLFQGFLRYIVDEAHTVGERPRGAELAKEFFRWVVRQGTSLDDLATMAYIASQDEVDYRNPFEDASLEKAIPGPKQIIKDLAELVLNEMSPHSRGEMTWNSIFHIEQVKGGSLAYYISQRYDFRKIREAWAGIPIVVLNADLTEEKVQELFPGRNVREYRPNTHWPKEARVWLDVRYRNGKTRLVKGKDDKDRERVFRQIEKVLKKHPNGDVGIITFKDFLPLIKARFPNETRIRGFANDDDRALYFGNVRSRNELKGVRVLIQIGTPWPNCAELERQAEVIHYGEEPLDKEKIFCNFKLKDSTGKETVITMKGCYRDPRLQDRLMSVWHDETMQALFRSRPLTFDESYGQQDFGSERIEGQDIYIFAKVAPQVPIYRLVTKEQAVPDLASEVLRVTAELCSGRTKIPTQAEITEALGHDVTDGQAKNVYRWLNKREGKKWREAILAKVRDKETSPEAAESADSAPESPWSASNVIPPQSGREAVSWTTKAPPQSQPRAPSELAKRNTS